MHRSDSISDQHIRVVKLQGGKKLPTCNLDKLESLDSVLEWPRKGAERRRHSDFTDQALEVDRPGFPGLPPAEVDREEFVADSSYGRLYRESNRP